MHIQYPMLFENETERNEHFKNFDALDFLDFLLDQMKIQIENAKIEADSQKNTESYTLKEIAEMSEQSKEEE